MILAIDARDNLQNDSVIISSIPCNICSNTEVTVIGTRNRDNNPLTTVICNKCGLVWSDPLPHNPRYFYQDDYRITYKGSYSPKPKHILRAGKVALTRLEPIKNLLLEPKTILDVGTGGGEFAYLLQSLGHAVTGIEPNKGYAAYSVSEYGLNVHTGFIQDTELPDNTFDIITIWHVLEHTENPCAVLSKLHDLLKPEGLLIVEVPNIEATCQSPQNTFHDAHLFNFNKNTLVKLGEKVGFIEKRSLISLDNGNITLFFSKSKIEKPQDLSIADNAEKIINIIKQHTVLKHYLSLTPYLRFFQRTYQSVCEKSNTANEGGGKDLLNKLYKIKN